MTDEQQPREHLHDVVATLAPVIHGVPDGELAGPSPCAELDLRGVVNHLLGTSVALRGVGAGEPPDPQDPWGTHGDHMGPGWRDELISRLTALADAWSQPEAWEGEYMDGAMQRAEVGVMAYAEVALHGWDIARGSGQQLAYSGAAAAALLAAMEEIGDMGRSMGAFGPAVPVADDAPDQDRALGLAGRDPDWTP